MNLLCDNDFLLKIAAFDLFDQTLEIFNAEDRQVFYLISAPYRMKVRKKAAEGRKRYGAAVHNRLATIFDRAEPLEISTSVVADRLTAILGLDEGEVRLIEAATQQEDSIILTGDKRCIQTLGQAPDLGDVRDCLLGRVWCLEVVLQALIERLGFDEVRRRVLPEIRQDGTARALFGSGLASTRQSVTDGLSSYVEDLRGQSGGLLVDSSHPLLVAVAAPIA